MKQEEIYVSSRPFFLFSHSLHKPYAVVLFFITLEVLSKKPHVVNEAATKQNMISYLEHEKAFFLKCKMVQCEL